MQHYALLCFIMFYSLNALSADMKIILDTTNIKINSELPQILYIVPWKPIKKGNLNRHKLKIDGLFDKAFDPIFPSEHVTPKLP